METGDDKQEWRNARETFRTELGEGVFIYPYKDQMSSQG